MVAPSARRKSNWSCLPVAAVTVYPSLAKSETATLPTPPLAPVTSTSPCPGVTPCCSSASTHWAAVKPAVPSIMLSPMVKVAGSFTTQLAGTRIYSPKPPGVFMPRS